MKKTLSDLMRDGFKISGLWTEEQTEDSLLFTVTCTKTLDSGTEIEFEGEFDALNVAKPVIPSEHHFGIKANGASDWVEIGFDYLDRSEEIAEILESGVKPIN